MPQSHIPHIDEYHAHIYFDGAVDRASAFMLREQLVDMFGASPTTVRETPVGPHPTPQLLVTFPVSAFARIVPFLMFNRGALSVLVHPESGDPEADHGDHALWLGKAVDLDFDFIRDFAAREKLMSD